MSIEAAVGSVEVVEVFLFLELVGEKFGVVDDDAVEEPVELFAVDAMGSLDFPVESRGLGLMYTWPIARTIAVGGPTASGGDIVPVKINRDSRGATDGVAAVTVNGHRTGFIVDTGAQLSQIDTRFARSAGLQPTGRPINTQTVACIAKITPVNFTSWRAGNISLPPTAAFASVQLIATKSRGQLAGILGIDVLDRYRSVTLDYQHSRLVLRAQGGDNP